MQSQAVGILNWSLSFRSGREGDNTNEEFGELIKLNQLAGQWFCRIYLSLVEDQVIVPFSACNRRLIRSWKLRLPSRRKACRRYVYCTSDAAFES